MPSWATRPATCRLGYKKTALIAVSIGFIGVGIQTLSGTMGSFGVYLLGAFIAGFSMCLLNTVVNPMLNKLGGGGNGTSAGGHVPDSTLEEVRRRLLNAIGNYYIT